MLKKIDEIQDEEKNCSTAGPPKCLVFDIGNEEYGIPLNDVKEVIGVTQITAVPSMPKYFEGIINLRGKIISVIDFRTKLGIPKIKYEEKKTTIIIAEVGSNTVGAIVDEVKEVVSLETSAVKKNIEIQSNMDREFIIGVAKRKDSKLTLLIDIDKVLNIDGLNLNKFQSEITATC